MAALVSAPAAHAEVNIDEQKKNSFMTLSAFECAVVSPNDKEGERLFKLGLKAGRDFLKFVQTDRNLYLKTIKSQVPMLWNLTAGPTADFVLGQIYADRMNKIYEEFTPDDELWNLTKQKMYREKNCELLGKS